MVWIGVVWKYLDNFLFNVCLSNTEQVARRLWCLQPRDAQNMTGHDHEQPGALHQGREFGLE